MQGECHLLLNVEVLIKGGLDVLGSNLKNTNSKKCSFFSIFMKLKIKGNYIAIFMVKFYYFVIIVQVLYFGAVTKNKVCETICLLSDCTVEVSAITQTQSSSQMNRIFTKALLYQSCFNDNMIAYVPRKTEVPSLFVVCGKHEIFCRFCSCDSNLLRIS